MLQDGEQAAQVLFKNEHMIIRTINSKFQNKLIVSHRIYLACRLFKRLLRVIPYSEKSQKLFLSEIKHSYVILSTQYNAIFHVSRSNIYQMIIEIFSLFSFKHRLSVVVWTAISTIYAIFFPQNKRDNVCPGNPTYKMVLSGVFIT